jgi:hypothetical protein
MLLLETCVNGGECKGCMQNRVAALQTKTIRDNKFCEIVLIFDGDGRTAEAMYRC